MFLLKADTSPSVWKQMETVKEIHVLMIHGCLICANRLLCRVCDLPLTQPRGFKHWQELDRDTWKPSLAPQDVWNFFLGRCLLESISENEQPSWCLMAAAVTAVTAVAREVIGVVQKAGLCVFRYVCVCVSHYVCVCPNVCVWRSTSPGPATTAAQNTLYFI